MPRLTKLFSRSCLRDNSTTLIATLRPMCRSQVRIQEECLAEGVQIPPPVKIKRRQKPAMNDDYTIPYRLGRRPGEQGPRPLPSNQGRVEKLATGQHVNTRYTTGNTQRLKPVKNTLTVGTWNVQTLWVAGKLELLRNEMKRFKYDIIGISEVRWTGKGERPISSGLGKRIHSREVQACYLAHRPERH